MTTEILLYVAIALLAACAGLLIALLRRGGPSEAKVLETRLASVREEVALSREQGGREGHLLRAEVSQSLTGIRDEVFQHLGVMSARQQEQLAAVLGALQQMDESARAGSSRLREEVGATLKGVGDSVVRTMGELSAAQKVQLDAVTTQVGTLATTVEGKLERIRSDNTEKLEQVRQTVDEKLQGVLEQRLGESFRSVSAQLEQVHRGLGEMQTLASGVGDLKKVLANVKVRGTWGEMQLGKLLAEVLAPEQYAANVATNEYSGMRVEYAIRLPGHDLGPVWLPIDAKFPLEDYQRLIDAQEAGDLDAADAAARQMEQRVRASAKEICVKYLNPPETTDFAIMFLPTEGLYGEVVRRPGLLDALQRESRVIVAGPITLWAILNSLQMGFRTLAIQQRSSEVWKVLGGVKTEFAKFGEVLAKVKKKLESASREMDQADRRTRAIERQLRDVQELPAEAADGIIAVDSLILAPSDDPDLEAA